MIQYQAVNRVAGYINQVDPKSELTFIEMLIDLAPHLEVTPWFVREFELEEVLWCWYTDREDRGDVPWSNRELAKHLVLEFKLGDLEYRRKERNQ